MLSRPAPVPLLSSMESLQCSMLWYDALMNILSTSAKEMNRRLFCVFSVIVGPKVPRGWGHRPQPTLSSLWAPLEGLCTGPEDGLHKVVGDLPLVLKQVFNLCTVCVTYMGEKNISVGRGEKLRWCEKTEKSVCPHLHDIHTCKLCDHHICTDISWHCS